MVEEEKCVEVEEREKVIRESTSSELQELGLSSSRVHLKSTKTGLYGRTLLTFAHAQYSSSSAASPALAKVLRLPESKISAGDNVGIFRAAHSFDGVTPLERGVVVKKTEFKYVVALQSKEESAVDLPSSQEPLALVMEANHVTYDRYMKCLDRIQKASNNINSFAGAQIIRVLLEGSDVTNENPNVKKEHRISKTIESFAKKDLNQEQKDAIQFCLTSQTLGLIHGPPGTGKTMTVCELIYQAVSMGMRVLACAGSNIAVDNIVERLAKTSLNVMRVGHPARMLPQIYEQCLDHKLRKTTSYKELKTLKQNINRQLIRIHKETDKKEKKEIKRLLTELRKELREQEDLSVKEVIQDTQVFCCTNAGAGDSLFRKYFSDKSFDLVVIDECAQALELSCWIPMLLGRRVVLAGDHKQLPPTIKSRSEDLSVTLFDRVLREFKVEDVSRQLRVQYRMNESIMEWSSINVYESQLKAHASVAKHSIDGNTEDAQNVLLFIDTAGAKMGESIDARSMGVQDKSRSKSNQGEADLVKIVLDELIVQGVTAKDIGVITPYNAQVDMVKKLLENTTRLSVSGTGFEGVEVSTVDGFQGREKECIVISMVRSNPIKQVGFLSDYRRMNVAVTRARKFVCLIADSDTVSSDPFLKQLLDYFTEHGEIRSATQYVGMSDVHFNVGFIEEKGKGGGSEAAAATKSSATSSDALEAQRKKKKKEVAVAASKKKKEGGELEKDLPKKSFAISTSAPHSDLPSTSHTVAGKFNESQLREEYTGKIETLLKSKDRQLLFEQLNSFQRRILHELADHFNLTHESIATMNPNGEVEKLKNMWLRRKVEVVKKEEEDNTSEDETVPTASSGGVMSQAAEKKKKKKLAKREEAKKVALASTGTVNGATLSSTAAKESLPDSRQPSAEVEDPQSAQAQYKEYVKKKQEEQKAAADAVKAAQDALIEAAAASVTKKTDKQQGKGSKKAAGKQQKESKQKPAAEDDGDDTLSFLASLAEDKKYCKYMLATGKKCNVYVEMMGSDCKYCDSRFCSRHGLQETHGCGEKVKKDAREDFAKSFMMQHRGEKHLRADQLDSLHQRLEEKIKTTVDSRKMKPKDDKK